MSIVRIGLAESKDFAEGYDAIFGKKKNAQEKKAEAKKPKAKASKPKASAKKPKKKKK